MCFLLQKLHKMNIIAQINSLGPVKDSEVEFHPLMVFTGESGLGKSYTAFLFYYLMMSFNSERLINIIRKKWPNIDNDFDDKTFSLKFKDLHKWINEGTPSYMGYLLGNNDFECSVNFIFPFEDEKKIEISIKNQDELIVISINRKVTSIFPESIRTSRSIIVSLTLSRYLCMELFHHSTYMPILLPPARAAFMGGNDMSSSVGMYREFLNKLSLLKAPSPIRKKEDSFFNSMVSKLLGGKLVSTNGEISLQIPGITPIPISATASSIKELSPFMLLLQNGGNVENYSVLFEEPEAHVHPLKQYTVMDILARSVNKGMYIQMTTHSDYMLSRFNQLIRLGDIKKKSENIFNEYCSKFQHNKNLYIDSDMVGAYFFKRENNNVKIITQDVGQGIQYDSFSDIVKKQMNDNASIDEYGEKVGLYFES